MSLCMQKPVRFWLYFIGVTISVMLDEEIPQSLNSLNPSRLDLGCRKKININFYFHTSLWCLKWFYKGLKGRHKIYCGNTKSKNKNLS